MRELVFEVEFKSDILLPATSNTEGKIDQLDFIAGSAFLGMVAKNYDKFSGSFDIFHSGKVRFGDAHILKNGKATYKIPYSYCHKKLQSEPIYNHHFLKDEDFEPEDKGGLGQLKQLRNGYITSEKEQVFVEYTYSQKSAYNKEKRKSKDSQMYGYKAIKKGSTWWFTVKIDGIEEKGVALIIETLEESKRLGKSKSAEYGEVAITYLPNAKVEHDTCKSDDVILYCNSRLALVDECGNPTYNLKYLCDGLGEANIDYKKTQIRTSSFAPFNAKRQTKDYERVCINKGSVIVLKDISAEQLQKIKNGVGAYLAEGFGDIIVNPAFLMERNFTLKKADPKEPFTPIPVESDLAKFLLQREKTKNVMLDIANEVDEFVSNKKSILSNIKPSQWGNIRSIASSAEPDFVEKVSNYIQNGAKKCDEKQAKTLIDSINNHKINKQKFTKLLAMKMGGKNDQK